MAYKKSVWLNGNESPSLGNVVAFDGECMDDGKPYRNTFLAISDCWTTIRLHMIEGETIEDFINKLKLLRDTTDNFINHLENNK